MLQNLAYGAGLVDEGNYAHLGVMIESHLMAGRQDLMTGRELTYGQSITDGCIGWEDSERVLDTLAANVRRRRVKEAGFNGK